MTYPPPPPPASPRPSLWQRFKTWPLIAKIATIGCGGLVALFALLIIIGIIVALVAPQDAGERSADTTGEPSMEASDDADESQQAEAEASREAEKSREAEASREAEKSREAEASKSAEASREAEESREAEAEASREAEESREAEASKSAEASREAEEEAEETSDEAPADDGGSHTATVVRTVDGDTLELANGERVRVHGIDTPEQGECGDDEATARMAQLVEGQQVTLTRHGENRGSWGRLIRYVDVGSTDAGLTLIEEGLAIARYDSRDGYGWHPREEQYHAEDAAAEDISCQAEPTPEPEPEPAPEPTQEEPAPGGNCAPGYSPCVPPYPPNVNCADVSGPITVTGNDPHGLDRDGDGVACESG